MNLDNDDSSADDSSADDSADDYDVDNNEDSDFTSIFDLIHITPILATHHLVVDWYSCAAIVVVFVYVLKHSCVNIGLQPFPHVGESAN